MLRLIETFSGIGSQVQALKNIGVDHEVVSIVEWEVGAMYAYDIIHNGPQDYSIYRHHTKDSIIKYLKQFTLSNNGKDPLTERALNSMQMSQLKAILSSIERNNNLVDIRSVTANALPDADILTYSFPCQDLSISGHWHNKTLGINRDANNRSTLLWEIERILIEYSTIEKPLPKFLIMENVSNILSSKHITNFNEWQSFLESLGYINQVYTLDARNFGVPQSRIRTYLISVLAEDTKQETTIKDYFMLNNLENVYLDSNKITPIGDYLRLDYSNPIYKNEAIESTPNYTHSREKIYKENVILAVDNKPNSEHARTVTTKQDRHPNSGIIKYSKTILVDRNTKYRNLTPRECFLLMGFSEEQYDNLIKENFTVSKGRKFIPHSKLIQLAGNSIVVKVLEEIFLQINEINELLEKKTSIR